MNTEGRSQRSLRLLLEAMQRHGILPEQTLVTCRQ